MALYNRPLDKKRPVKLHKGCIPMIDSSLVVQSAASSFNNAALSAPDFFWTAVLSLPIFIATALFSGALNAKFFSDDKTSNRTLTLVIAGTMVVWLLTRGSYAVLRDGISHVHLLCAFALFWGAGILTREALAAPRPAFLEKMTSKGRRLFIAALSVAGIAVLGYSAPSTWQGFGLMAGSAALGILTGRLLHRRNKSLGSVYSSLSVLGFVLATGMVMQPEFFRFGQLGNLTVILLCFLAAFVFFAVANIVLRHVKPAAWISHFWYKKFLLLIGLGVLLVFAMFLITESVLAFLVLAAACGCATLLIAKHQPKSAIRETREFGAQLWSWALALFGILIGQPVLVCLAILVWKSTPREKFWETFGNMLGILKEKRIPML
jgi:predicted small integral membrane protein